MYMYMYVEAAASPLHTCAFFYLGDRAVLKRRNICAWIQVVAHELNEVHYETHEAAARPTKAADAKSIQSAASFVLHAASRG